MTRLSTTNSRHEGRANACSVLLICLLALAANGWSADARSQTQGGQESADAPILEAGSWVEGALNKGAKVKYQFKLEANRHAKVTVEHRGFPILVTISTQDGAVVMDSKAQSGDHGPRVLRIIAEKRGAEGANEYSVVIEPADKALSGPYKIKVDDVRSATEQDRRVVLILRKAMEARHLQERNDAESFQKAEQKYLEAIKEIGVAQEQLEEARMSAELAALYARVGDFVKAQSALERTLAIREKALGPEDLNTISTVTDLGLIVRLNGEYEKSEGMLKRALAVRERELGADHPDVAETLNNMAGLYRTVGNYKKSEEMYLRSLSIREKAFGPEHSEVGVSLNNLALMYAEWGIDAKAEELYLRALKLLEKTKGPEHPEVATVNNNLGLWYQQRSALAKAEPLLLRGLELRKKTLGEKNYYVAESLNNLACLYADRGEFSRAESTYQESLALLKDVLGEAHPDSLSVLANLVCTYNDRGEYQKSQELNEHLIQLAEKVFGKEGDEYGYFLSTLGVTYVARGDYSKAEEIFNKSLQIIEKTAGVKHPNYGYILHSLSLTFFYRGQYDRAEETLVRALSVLEKGPGANHPGYASSLHDLGVLYTHKGQYPKAESCLRRALEITNNSYGDRHPTVARDLFALGELFLEKGEYQKAEEAHLKALDIREKTLGAEHFQVTLSLNAVGAMHTSKGEFAKAAEHLQRALVIRERILGSKHAYVAQSLMNLATLRLAQRQFDEAEPLLRRALSTYETAVGRDHPAVAEPLNDLAEISLRKGRRAEAEELYLRALKTVELGLGKQHPYARNSLLGLAKLYEASGDVEGALKHLVRGRAVSDYNIDLNIATGSEQQKLSYLRTVSDDTDRLISFHVKSAPLDARAARLAMSTILHRKGRALDAMVDTIALLRSRSETKYREVLERWSGAKASLANLIFRGPGKDDPAKFQGRLLELENLVERLEAELSSAVEFRASTQESDIDRVKESIPEGAALVEITAYRPFDAKADEPGPARYVAYVLGRGGDIRWTDLGDVESIDKDVDALRAALGDPNNRDVIKLARALDARVMSPLRRLLGESELILLSPDGKLNLVPFGALVDEQKQFRVKTYSFVYLTSGRDLLRLHNQLKSRQKPVIVADPDFGKVPAAGAGSPRPFGGAYFDPLPGTAAQATELKPLLPGSLVWTRGDANETSVKQVSGPEILHIATHGFFVDNTARQAPGNRQPGVMSMRMFVDDKQVFLGRSLDPKIYNPLLLSGLALAGVNNLPAEGDDGILTALEAASLNLWGTKLVVLSACETGVGKASLGEGVYGLRRALILAGSESQVVSLWQVSDAATKDLMVDYYKELLAGHSRSEALRKVQLRFLYKSNSKRWHPYYWAGFIPSGKWTPLGDATGAKR